MNSIFWAATEKEMEEFFWKMSDEEAQLFFDQYLQARDERTALLKRKFVQTGGGHEST